MPLTFYPPDESFAASSGSNVNYTSGKSYFDHPPSSTKNLSITPNADDDDPRMFETGETFDLSWEGNGGGTMEGATVIRSDYLGSGQGAIVFEGTNSTTGETFQIVWAPGIDLEQWYYDAGGTSNPPAFWTYNQDDDEFEYICYAAGTLIDTPDGPRAVDALQVGDSVETLDHGPQPIRWRRVDMQALGAVPEDNTPVLIAAGALGPGRPKHDLIVSPQHRILLGGQGQGTHAFGAEVFAPAKALTVLPGVRHMLGKRSVTWVHFACDRHEVVSANGCFAESLLLGPMVLRGLSRDEHAEVTAIFGEGRPSEALNGPAARPCLGAGAVRRVLNGACMRGVPSWQTEALKWDIDAVLDRAEAARNPKRAARAASRKRTGQAA